MLVFHLLLLLLHLPPSTTSSSSSIIHYKDLLSTHSLTYRIEPGQNTSVLLTPTYPWESDVHAEGSVIYDPRVQEYRAYYVSCPNLHNQVQGRVMTIATSPDGKSWTRPMLSLYPWESFPNTNILMKLQNPLGEISQISVFVDAGGKYDLFLLASDVPDAFVSYPRAVEDCSHKECMYRFTSSDGLHFQPSQLIGSMSKGSDGSFVYRKDNRKDTHNFTAYLKIGLPSPPGSFVPWDVGAGHSRMIMQSNSIDNGQTWSGMTYVASVDWRDSQDDQLVGLYGQDAQDVFLKSSLDGRPIMMGTMGMFHALSQTVDNQFAVSDDGGGSWWRPSRRPYRHVPPIGEYGSGVNFCMRSLVQDVHEQGTVHSYFSGTEGIHGDIHSTQPYELLKQEVDRLSNHRFPTFGWSSIRSFPGFDGNNNNYESLSFARSSIQFHGALMRTSWQHHRFFSVVPASGGSVPGTLVMKGYNCTRGKGVQLHVNAVTTVKANTGGLFDGMVRAALMVSAGANVSTLTALNGYALSDSCAWKGDQVNGELNWTCGGGGGGGGPVPGINRTVHVKIELTRSRLYGYEFSC